jgi:hypothetical protein
MNARAKTRPVHSDGTLPLPSRWAVLEYQPVAPFALRPSLATSSGGKTLLVPTPYAIKLALVDATIRASGMESGQLFFEAVRACPVAITPTRWVCVTNTFGRVLRLHQEKGNKKGDAAEPASEDDPEGGNEDEGRPLKRTIAYREIAILEGTMKIAIGLREPASADRIVESAALVNSFGRRGSFFQLIAHGETAEPDLNAVVVDSAGAGRPPRVTGDVACLLDDTGPLAEFDRISTFSEADARIGVERVVRHHRKRSVSPVADRLAGRAYICLSTWPDDERIAMSGRNGLDVGPRAA